MPLAVRCALAGLSLGLCAPTFAAQPIFDEMPRWSGGYGVQFIYERRLERALIEPDGDRGAAFGERIDLLHIEGVYTWHKSIRVTAKLPVVLAATRSQPGPDGDTVEQSDQGLGDPILALPLKRYFNLDGRSGSWTFAPQLRLGVSPVDDYAVYSDGWGAGASAGWETETYRYHLALSVTGWVLPGWGRATEPLARGRVEAATGINLHAFDSSGHLKVKVAAIGETDGAQRVEIGPVLYWRFTDLVHGQAVWRHDLYDAPGELDHGDGDAFRLGLGFVF